MKFLSEIIHNNTSIIWAEFEKKSVIVYGSSELKDLHPKQFCIEIAPILPIFSKSRHPILKQIDNWQFVQISTQNLTKLKICKHVIYIILSFYKWSNLQNRNITQLHVNLQIILPSKVIKTIAKSLCCSGFIHSGHKHVSRTKILQEIPQFTTYFQFQIDLI